MNTVPDEGWRVERGREWVGGNWYSAGSQGSMLYQAEHAEVAAIVAGVNGAVAGINGTRGWCGLRGVNVAVAMTGH